jgi:tetratricopeptide (TPR) repeat protein
MRTLRITTKVGMALIAILLTIPAAVHAQNINAAKVLGQTPDSGSLPLWSKPGDEARKGLGDTARLSERGVLLVGHPKAGTGTAWVISKKHRLLITNAHVGDLRNAAGGEMIAIPSGTAQVYAVEKVWYHPGVRRYFQGNTTLSVRSMDPKDGDIDPQSPDLAVLQLSSDGPDLSVEFPIATAEELESLFAQPAAILGFPAHDTQGWPALGEKAASTYHDGVISRLTDFQNSPGAPAEELQFVQYTMATWGGFSGSPVFLPSGRVGAVHNMARTVKGQNGVVKSLPHGIRADCVLEMLVHHGLDDKMPFKIDKTKVALDRWTKADPKSEKARADYSRAVTLANEGEYLVFVTEDYDKGIEKCNEVMKLVPNYARAYSIRSNAYNNFRFDNHERLSEKAELTLANQAFEDARKAVQLDPSDPYYVLVTCGALNSIGHLTDDASQHQKVIAVVNELLTSNNLSQENKGSAMSKRAVAYDNLNQIELAWRDHNEAVRLWPDEPAIRETRAMFFEGRELSDWGQSDRALAKRLRSQKIETGMKMTDVTEGGAAHEAGLRVGDIIVNVGTKRVKNLEDLTSALAAANGPVSAIVIRAESNQRETVTIAPRSGKLGIKVVPIELK